MDLYSLMRSRCAVRSFLPKPVEPEKLERILEAGRISPSAVNFQPRRFMVLQSERALAKAHRVYEREWFSQAPLIIAVCGLKDVAWRREDGKLHMDIDCAIAADHMTLAATAEGLGSCWVCAFDTAAFSRSFELEADIEPVVLLPIGYPAVEPNTERHASARKPIEEIARFL